MSYDDKGGEPGLFGKHGEKILNFISFAVCAIAVIYFTLRLFEIIPNSV